MRIFLTFLTAFFLNGCLGTPEGVDPVEDFKIDRYTGKWFEIARLDHSFERGLNNVTAEYYLRDDGGVKVINRGFSPAENKWKQVEGKAYFVEKQNVGYLKVSFFGPFYGSYVVFELDKEDYRYAFVTSHSRSYLWLLSRTPTVKNDLLDRFIQKSKNLGYNTEKLIFVEHNSPCAAGLNGHDDCIRGQSPEDFQCEISVVVPGESIDLAAVKAEVNDIPGDAF